MIECRIHIRAADDLGCHPRLLFGRRQNNEIVYVLSIDGRSWHRRRQETAEIFEARIVRDLVEAARAGCGAAVLVG
jgi:exopolysaccharide biosynthesis protein